MKAFKKLAIVIVIIYDSKAALGLSGHCLSGLRVKTGGWIVKILCEICSRWLAPLSYIYWHLDLNITCTTEFEDEVTWDKNGATHANSCRYTFTTCHVYIMRCIKIICHGDSSQRI